MIIKTNLKNLNIPEEKIAAFRPKASAALDSLWGSKEPCDAWVQLPMQYTEEDIEYLLNAADYVRGWAKLMVVIGTPAACAGAKAAIEALPKYEYGLEVIFAGDNFDPEKYAELTEKMKANEAVICLLSDYEETDGTAAAFAILKDVLKEKFEDDHAVSRRIIAVTDKETRLREEAEHEGYLTVTSQAGLEAGFNALFLASLLPMSVAGLDIRAIIDGAKEAALSPMWDAGGTDYAIARYMMAGKGHTEETLIMTDSHMEAFGSWISRIYGACEEGRTMDGDGETVPFVTVLPMQCGDADRIVPSGPLAGKSLRQLQAEETKSMIDAFRKAGDPVAQIDLEEMDAAAFGQLIYFFEMSAAISKML